MNLKSIILLVLVSTCHYLSNAQLFNMSLLGSANYDTDNVPGVATDDTYTYVVQNLYSNPTTPPYTSYSISGNIAVGTATSNEHASVIIDRIDNATSTTTILARIDITNSSSSVTATGVTLYNGYLYIVGYFEGSVKPNGSLPTKTANAIDMFVCKVSTTSTGVVAWNQSGGDGEEHATCIYNDLGTMTVGGYYTASGSTSVSSTWPTSTVTTAPSLLGTGQKNTFLSRFSSTTLSCSQATGWMSLTNASSSAQINGVTSVSIALTTVSYVTGSIIGSATSPVLSGSTSGATMFTARFVHTSSPPAWGWGVLEGTYFNNSGSAPNPVNAGKGIVFGSSTSEVYVTGAAAYTAGTGPAGYTNGNSDAVLIKYTGITGTTPTRSFGVAMGTGILDVANAVVNDGTHIIVTGNMSTGNYTYGNVGGSSSSYTSIAPSHVFIARYTTSGALDWGKTGDAYSYTSNSTAMATTGKCNVVFGGAFDRKLDWDSAYQIYGATSPNTDHLYLFSFPVEMLKFSQWFPSNVNKGWGYIATATGATSYSWLYIPTVGQTITISPNNTASVTLTLVSGGVAGNTFDVAVIGSFTHGGASCNNGRRYRIVQNNKKEDEEITGVDMPEESLNTFNLFPNPFTNSVEIDYSFAVAENGILQITDLQGRVVSEKVLSAQSDSKMINTGDWAAGTYVARLIQNNNTLFTKQIVKQ